VRLADLKSSADNEVEGDDAEDTDIEATKQTLRDEAHHVERSTSAKKLFLHVGPAKTGTSTIQAAAIAMQDYLREDGIRVLTTKDLVDAEWRHLWGYLDEANSFSLASCFDNACGKQRHQNCVASRDHLCPTLSEKLNNLTQPFPASFISAEHFGVITNISSLASMLNGLNINTTVIIGYRPFYDLFGSQCRQRGCTNGTSDVKGFNKWGSIETIMSTFEKKSSYSVWRKYSKYFDNIKVHTLNDDIVPTVICDDFGAINTCQYTQKVHFSSLHANTKANDNYTGTCLDPERNDLLFNLSWKERSLIGDCLTDAPPADWESTFRQEFLQSRSSCFGVR
jgi:hypothetical protein